ncbi:amino acid dehydrogenase [Betaproteobacteria bacterium GR16-43]|nr:amino acid dehydrogenase [Betaproteobacteria bacterium GR16-43]
MKILVLGAGIVGTATAWYAARDGHEVTVVDRQAGPAMETSFANGGQVSVGHSEPWANPGAPLKILRWLGRDDAPLLFRPRADAAQWAWILRFLVECTPWRTRENIRRILGLALYSRATLQQLRAETGIAYDYLGRGILHYFTDERDFERARDAAGLMREYGLDRAVQTAAQALALEPALAGSRVPIVGATYTSGDESGDAYLFTRALAGLAEAAGVSFHYRHDVLGATQGPGGLSGVLVRSAGGGERVLAADAYVAALGSHTPLFVRPLGVSIPVYPAKGYSATLEVTDAARAPTVSLTDEAAKLVLSRFGNRLRVAGTAELSGYSTALNPVRCEALVERMREVFPGAADYDRPAFWAGLRPATPSNVPLIGRTRIPNLYLNTGHGTLGWTLGAGSGKALADILSGRKPEVDFPFLGFA